MDLQAWILQRYPWWSILILLFIPNPCFAASSISADQSLSGDQTITSEGGNFVLGFFSPGKSQNYYIGIWYKKISKRTVVWVANRETPLSDPSSSELRISDDRNLVLLSQSKAQIWSTNATSITPNSTVVAEILDTGNLVLRDGSNSSKLFWQSFDHPTDTWLPGGKFGLNKVTGQNQLLISWRNSEDPAPGIYSFEVDPNGTSQYFIKWNRSEIFWSSGYWNGRIFSLIPEMVPGFLYNFEYISNERENYFTYSLIQTNVISRLVVDLSGQVKQLTWLENSDEWILFWSQPKAQCDVHHLCGLFGVCNDRRLPYCTCAKGYEASCPKEWNLGDLSGGCVRSTPLQCSRNNSANGDQDRFYSMPDMKLPENHRNLTVGSAELCEEACLSNCSCAAYSYGSECSLWYGSLLNLQQLFDGARNGGTLKLRLAASELPSSKHNKGKTTGAVVGAVTGLLAVLAIAWMLIWTCRRRRFRELRVVEGALVPFRYSELRRVTQNFSEKLGEGGFGSVFKGTMPDSTEVAVKKLEGIRQGEKQFRSEVSTIGTIQHVNLVRLRGFCSEGSTKRLLVYDYMPRGSLHTALFQNPPLVVDWNTRYQIALGTARGLTYLHEKCRDCIIHCDIKPENILLDDSFVPKVADFGLAKLLGREFSRVLTTVRGTIGYLAPEWISGVAITAKADVYSYGMLLFEIISGRRNIEQSKEGKFGFFPEWAAKRLMEGEVVSLLDSRLEGEADLEELNRIIRTAYWCIQDGETFRPTMGQVVQILEGVLDVNMPPIPRSLHIMAGNADDIAFFSDISSNQSCIPTSSQNESSTSSASRKD